ncbi:hypothetical protein VP01_355g4 [Puccinia sorghi]|uniref:Uncharacterized protein n=1 Tax=Puccinia sorghi TaxID=27349 RepID=A0A0L6UVD1_9BASI|nr:hypothetical protein VP01_355g4 [Puccinia sorghi]
MQPSIAFLLTCWVPLSLQLESMKLVIEKHAGATSRLARRTPAAGRQHLGTEARRSISGRQNAAETYSSAAASSSVAAFATGYGEGMSETYITASAASVPKTSAVASLAVGPAPLPVPSAPPTCDNSNAKAEINRFLVKCEAALKRSTAPIIARASTVDASNASQLATQIAAYLKDILAQLKLSLSYVQLCGIDAKPLSNEKGVAISDVSWSAFQVVLTLKDVYHSITGLYKPFPVIKAQCSGGYNSDVNDNFLCIKPNVLVAISTALAGLIGACGEQINLFDTQFFPLVTPQIEELTDLDDDFVSFIGDFIS